MEQTWNSEVPLLSHLRVCNNLYTHEKRKKWLRYRFVFCFWKWVLFKYDLAIGHDITYGKSKEGSYFILSYLIKIRLSVWRHRLANLNNFKTWISLERKEVFENSKQHFSSLWLLLLLWLHVCVLKRLRFERCNFRHSSTEKRKADSITNRCSEKEPALRLERRHSNGT